MGLRSRVEQDWHHWGTDCLECGEDKRQHDEWRRMDARYCSDDCKRKAGKRRQSERHWHTNYCGECREQFTSKRSDAKFCSPKCRMKAHRKG